jgi:hypothetical protein
VALDISFAPSLFSLTLSKRESSHAARGCLLIRAPPPPVYTNCLMVSLNARQHFRDTLHDAQLDALVFVSSTHPSVVHGPTPVRVSQQAHVHLDSPPSPGSEPKSPSL